MQRVFEIALENSGRLRSGGALGGCARRMRCEHASLGLFTRQRMRRADLGACRARGIPALAQWDGSIGSDADPSLRAGNPSGLDGSTPRRDVRQFRSGNHTATVLGSGGTRRTFMKIPSVNSQQKITKTS